jgi:CheY-like chemotaxis protein
MTTKMNLSTIEVPGAPRKAVFSGAQTIGRGRGIRFAARRKPSFKDYADVILALVCLAAMAGSMYFAKLDSNYATSLRMTAAIQRALGIRGPSGTDIDMRKTILVVDNDEGQRLIAKTALERYGYNVALADNGAQAMGLFRKAPDRVSLVLVEPRSGGEPMIQQIKSIRSDLPILVSETAGEKLQAGATARIERPFSAMPLAEMVQTTLASKSIR